MKRWSSFTKGYEWQAVLAPLFKLLEALFDLFVPLIVASMIDHSGNRHTTWLCFGMLIGTAVFGVLCSVSAQWFAARTAVGVSSRLRSALFQHIGTLSAKQVDEVGPDTLLTRVTSDINQVQNGINMALRLLLRSPFIVFGAMVMAFMVDVEAGKLFAVAIVVLAVATSLIMILGIPLVKKAQGKLDCVMRKVRQDLEGIRPIRAFGKQEKELEDFKKADRTLTKADEQSAFVSSCMDPITYILINLAVVWLLHMGAIRVYAGSLSQGSVVALYNYMAQIVVELVKLASLLVTIEKAAACASRIDQILAIKPDMTYGKETTGTGKTALRVEHVTFAYAGTTVPALKDISFTLQEGETLGVIGSTGSGKSTLASLLARLYDCDQGKIYIYDKKISSYTAAALHQMVALVMQKAVLFTGSIRKNLCLGKEIDDSVLQQAVLCAQAKDVVDTKGDGLDSWLEQGGSNLSGGQKQRLAMARAIAHQPKILVLDDSSSALDYATDARLRQALAERKGTTVIISQRVASIKQADHILVLDDGRMCGYGTHDALLKGCRVYQDICRVQRVDEVEHA